MNWLRRVFSRGEEIPRPVTVTIEPDPDMEPGQWSWSCYDCGAGGKGEDQQMRRDAMTHCLLEGHTTHGEHEE